MLRAPDEEESTTEEVRPPRWLEPVDLALRAARRLHLGWARELAVLTPPGRRTLEPDSFEALAGRCAAFRLEAATPA